MSHVGDPSALFVVFRFTRKHPFQEEHSIALFSNIYLLLSRSTSCSAAIPGHRLQFAYVHHATHDSSANTERATKAEATKAKATWGRKNRRGRIGSHNNSPAGPTKNQKDQGDA
jgi:hypothetical protein